MTVDPTVLWVMVVAGAALVAALPAVVIPLAVDVVLEIFDRLASLVS